ncbi:alpha/beta-hydrolase [Trametes gibbosa]|nr:alpha/beta-hydrolase [Trametes gibbosa]
MDSALYKDATVSRGLTYHYFYSPATAGQPTLLLLHGFPSSSFEWHRQVEYFRPKGYGLVVPDILGAGKTAKPEDLDAFRLKLIAQDIIDLLDAEGLDKVVGIAHDWGSWILSRLANLHDQRFHAYAWNAVAYQPPSPQPMDIDALIEYLKVHTGDPRFGYWKFFNTEDAHVVCERHLDSFLHVLYPQSPEMWFEWFTPVGKLQEWVEANRTTAIPNWLTQEEFATIRRTLEKSGLKGLMAYYKAAVRSLNCPDEAKIPHEAWTVRKPVLFIVTTRDAAVAPEMGLPNIKKYAPQAKIVELEVGHWIQLEATERVNAEWDAWLEGLGLRDVSV